MADGPLRERLKGEHLSSIDQCEATALTSETDKTHAHLISLKSSLGDGCTHTVTYVSTVTRQTTKQSLFLK